MTARASIATMTVVMAAMSSLDSGDRAASAQGGAAAVIAVRNDRPQPGTAGSRVGAEGSRRIAAIMMFFAVCSVEMNSKTFVRYPAHSSSCARNASVTNSA